MSRTSLDPTKRTALLVEAALTVFLRDGYANARMADIATEATVSPGLSYRYFKSKTELLDAVSDRLAEEYITRMLTTADPPDINASQKLDLFFERVTQYLCDFPQIIALHNDGNRELWDKVAQKVTGLALPKLKLLIEEGNADGSFNCPHAAYAAIFLIGGLANLHHDAATHDLNLVRQIFAQILGEKQ